MWRVIAGLFLVFVAVTSAIAYALWTDHFDEYMVCLKTHPSETDKCFMAFLLLSPPMQTVQSIQQACDKSDADCLVEMGKEAGMRKLEKSAENEVNK